MAKLNVGCGNKKFPGFINADIRPDVQPDIVMDVTDLSQFRDGSLEYVMAHDVLEHISHAKTWEVLTEWVRCIQIGGTLEIQVPNIDLILRNKDMILAEDDGDSSKRLSHDIFGHQDYPTNFHYAVFTYSFFKCMEKRLNLKINKYIPETGHNHRVYFTKLEIQNDKV